MNNIPAREKLRSLWEEHLATKRNYQLGKEVKLSDIDAEVKLDDTFLAGLVSTYLEYGNLEKSDNPEAPLRPNEILINIIVSTEKRDKELDKIKLDKEDETYRKNFKNWNNRLINIAKLLKECLNQPQLNG